MLEASKYVVLVVWIVVSGVQSTRAILEIPSAEDQNCKRHECCEEEVELIEELEHVDIVERVDNE